jgi:Protein of unknown function (DUF3014)
MEEPQDLELDGGRGFEPTAPPRRRQPRGPMIAGLVALLLVLGLGAYYLMFRHPSGPPASAPGAGEETAAPTPAPPRPTGESEIELPPLGASDSLVRQLAGRLSADPGLASWLAGDELIRRFGAAVDNIAEGTSPKPHLRSLAPQASFQVTQREGRIFVDPASYRRYDLLVGVFSSVDAGAAAHLYRQLKPLIDQAYRDLGYPRQDFDDTLARAIGRLLAVPAPEGDVELAPKSVAYAFADPALENRSAAEKQLLRLGPENVRRVQAKLRELANALGITPR